MCISSDIILEWFKALATPSIALLAVGIALQQYKTNKIKIQLDLFDRRIGIYEKTQKFLAQATLSESVEFETERAFYDALDKSYFLFKSKLIPEYLEQVSKAYLDLKSAYRSIKSGDDKLRDL